MCGIAGIFYYKDPQKIPSGLLLESMSSSLAHRGPDGEGVYRSEGIGLANRRLAILDTSSAGRQPMSNRVKNMWVTYNGEIYNFKEIRSLLETKGHIFFSHTDTEVILNAYEEWGVECVNKFSGIFAIALWDAVKKMLWLVRDPVGVKPLFYHDDGRRIVFASEIKAILQDKSIPCDIDAEGLDAFFSFSYTPCPLTALKSIRQVGPGEWLTYTNEGQSHKKYWQLNFPTMQNRFSLPQAVEQFESLFCKVVSRQMVSDVPLGIFLSGGMDSIAILRTVRRKLGQGISAFTLGMGSDKSFDEAPIAKRAAQIFGADIHTEYLNSDKISLFKKIAMIGDEPFGDSSMLALHALCKMTKEHMSVALSGDGADELLAGYDTYRAASFARYYRMIPIWLRKKILTPLARRIPVGDTKYNTHQTINRFINAAEQGEFRDHCCWRIIASDQIKKKVYSPQFFAATNKFDPVGLYEKYMRVLPGKNMLNKMLYADMAFYLPNDMLIKVDRMSMANGLEVRVPFLDTELIEFCSQLPEAYKLHNGKTRKYILKKMLTKDVPRGILNRKKSGFNVPIEAWFREKEVTDFFYGSLNEVEASAAAYLNLNAVMELLECHRRRKEDNAHLLFALLIFFLWMKNLHDRGR